MKIEMKIENAKYYTDKRMNADGDVEDVVTCIGCTMNGVPNTSIPIDEDNTHYVEIMRQVKEDGLTIADAD
tara:strand:+ start:81 stop:293 length:213 start_codon:yes stop_codon:yes gene_type:complete